MPLEKHFFLCWFNLKPMKHLLSYIIASILHCCDICDAYHCVLIVFFSENRNLAHAVPGCVAHRWASEGRRGTDNLRYWGFWEVVVEVREGHTYSTCLTVSLLCILFRVVVSCFLSSLFVVHCLLIPFIFELWISVGGATQSIPNLLEIIKKHTLRSIPSVSDYES